ncbi:MAG: hypothetical protein COA60_002510 [Robiginitomaculum sp.]|nr:hypothetical protein [Robiginitomaculum sp.]
MIKFFSTIVIAITLSITPAMADVTVKKQDNGWQVTADAEPITSVLEALGKQAGIKISGTNKLIADPQITGNWSGPLEDVLARILRGADYATETAIAKDGSQYIVRLIVLSGEIGQAPAPRAMQAARRLPTPPTAEQTEQIKRDGARVTGLLETKARVVAGLPHSPSNPVAEARTTRAGGGNGITRNEDGSFDIDPETQARLAEATRRAQADLQALVNALRQNEQDN